MQHALFAKMEKNELISVLEWYPAANDVGEMSSSLINMLKGCDRCMLLSCVVHAFRSC